MTVRWLFLRLLGAVFLGLSIGIEGPSRRAVRPLWRWLVVGAVLDSSWMLERSSVLAPTLAQLFRSDPIAYDVQCEARARSPRG